MSKKRIFLSFARFLYLMKSVSKCASELGRTVRTSVYGYTISGIICLMIVL